MDIHPPHQPMNTWKDVLIHLLTITIGLFIALTLEAAVQATHNRHLVRDAHENLRHWNWDSYGDAAWKTARESGAVAYMDSGWISAYSWVYAQQDYVNSTALALVNEETRASAPLKVAMNPSKLKRQ